MSDVPLTEKLLDTTMRKAYPHLHDKYLIARTHGSEMPKSSYRFCRRIKNIEHVNDMFRGGSSF